MQGLIGDRFPEKKEAPLLQILRCAQDDTPAGCHPERSEGSLVDLWVITSKIPGVPPLDL